MTIQVEAPPFAQLYVEVQQFYARHFHLLDAGKAEEWAETFTEDGWFWPQTIPQPARGRAILTEGVRGQHERLNAIGEQHRHWHGMIDVEPRPDGALSVRCYALVYATPEGGPTRIHAACVCEDLLVRGDDGALRVAGRRVTRDDIREERL
jgi:hypothetical protein